MSNKEVRELTLGDKVVVNGKEHEVMAFTRRDGKTYVRIKEV